MTLRLKGMEFWRIVHDFVWKSYVYVNHLESYIYIELYIYYCTNTPTSSESNGENMFAANPTFARIGSRISFDMLKSLRKAGVFVTFQNLK